MAVPFIDPAMLQRIMEPLDPAASLRSSATAFEALGKTFDAEFSRRMARAAAIDPTLYVHWAQKQAERVQTFYRGDK